MPKTNKQKITEALKTDTWLDLAWDNISKTKFVLELLGAVGKKHKDIQAQLAALRAIDRDKAGTWPDMRQLAAAQQVHVAATLPDEWWQRKLRPALLRGHDLGRPLATLVDRKSKDMVVLLLHKRPLARRRGQHGAVDDRSRQGGAGLAARPRGRDLRRVVSARRPRGRRLGDGDAVPGGCIAKRKS